MGEHMSNTKNNAWPMTCTQEKLLIVVATVTVIIIITVTVVFPKVCSEDLNSARYSSQTGFCG